MGQYFISIGFGSLGAFCWQTANSTATRQPDLNAIMAS
jgi:hypothetical protein